MKALIIAALLAAASLTTPALAQDAAPAAASQVDRDVAELEALNAQWLNAYVSRDRAALEAVLAPDFLAFRAGGGVSDRDALLNGATGPGGRSVKAIAWENLTIRVFGDTAVVAARSLLTRERDGQDVVSANEYADVYVRRDGRWQAVAAHVIRAPTP